MTAKHAPSALEFKDLSVSAPDAQIISGANLAIPAGELHVLMGPNGSGKSTLASALMGSPEYEITGGQILLNGQDITDQGPEERGAAGLFLGFQYPQSISGVSVLNFLRQALSARFDIEDFSVLEVRLKLLDWSEKLGVSPDFAERHLNDGFSGGERKRNEVLQMAMLEPTFAVLDEPDSGLDIDAINDVANGITLVREANPEMGVLLVTHYRRILKELTPDKVHVLLDGRIAASGGVEIADEIEARGFDSYRKKAA